MSKKAQTLKIACHWASESCALELLVGDSSLDIDCDNCVFYNSGHITKEQYDEFIDDICNKLKQGAE